MIPERAQGAAKAPFFYFVPYFEIKRRFSARVRSVRVSFCIEDDKI